MAIGGKDLLNMDFRVKPRSFNFVGAGTRFKYTRDQLKREKITAQGPLTQSVELLVRWILEEFLFSFFVVIVRFSRVQGLPKIVTGHLKSFDIAMQSQPNSQTGPLFATQVACCRNGSLYFNRMVIHARPTRWFSFYQVSFHFPKLLWTFSWKTATYRCSSNLKCTPCSHNHPSRGMAVSAALPTLKPFLGELEEEHGFFSNYR